MIFLQETDRRHMDIVNTYRTHLLSAVQVYSLILCCYDNWTGNFIQLFWPWPLDIRGYYIL